MAHGHIDSDTHNPRPNRRWHPWPTAKPTATPSSMAKPINLTPITNQNPLEHNQQKTHRSTTNKKLISRIHDPQPKHRPTNLTGTNRSTIIPKEQRSETREREREGGRKEWKKWERTNPSNVFYVCLPASGLKKNNILIKW